MPVSKHLGNLQLRQNSGTYDKTHQTALEETVCAHPSDTLYAILKNAPTGNHRGG